MECDIQSGKWFEAYALQQINEAIPAEIKDTKRLMRKYPSIKDQCREYIAICQATILELKNSLIQSEKRK